MANEKQPLVFTSAVPNQPLTPPYHATETIQNFTATGRPFNPSKADNGSALSALNSTDAMCLDSPNYLPRRYTDDSIITIPVLPPDSLPPLGTSTNNNNNPVTNSKSPNTTISPTTNSYHPTSTTIYADLYSGKDPIQHEPTSPRLSLKFWHRRSSSSISSSSSPSHPGPVTNQPSFRHRRSSSKPEKLKVSAFVMKQVTRGEYLKHYAKDDDGKYIGSEEPARDCILRNAEDLEKWRRHGGEDQGKWRNEI